MESLLAPEPDLEQNGNAGGNGYKKKYTLDEYLYELKNPDSVPQVSKTDPNDPGYHRKYAMSMPPLICYRYKQQPWNLVNTKNDVNRRAVFYAWDNLTDFEKQAIEDCKQWFQQTKGWPIPADFIDREVLKFLQADFFKMPVSGEKIYLHLLWLDSLARKPALSQRALTMMQSGAMYILGRDKCYRPIMIMDAHVLVNMIKQDKESVTEEIFIENFVFLWQYMRNVMFLPGMSDMWVQIVSFGNLGMTALPRKPILAFADTLQKNMMFYTHKQYYVNCSWGMRTIYNGLKGWIDPQTAAKIDLTDKSTVPELTERIHPCQLEKRFGGNLDTPTNFWPPYVGAEFQPPGQPFEGEIMTEEEYRQALQNNPEMNWHPEYMTSHACPSRDFTFSEPELPIQEIVQNLADSSQQNLSVPRATATAVITVGSAGQSVLSSGSLISRSESVYFDAYTGIDSIDQDVKMKNQIIKEATNIDEHGHRTERQYENSEYVQKQKKQSQLQYQEAIQEEPLLETSVDETTRVGSLSSVSLRNSKSQNRKQTVKKKGCCCVIF